MEPVAAVVLAAGYGKRMKSQLPKVMHPVTGTPMVGHVVRSLQEAQVPLLVVVVSAHGAPVQDYLQGQVTFACQDPPLGTGHALLQAVNALPESLSEVLVVPGDTPLLSPELFQRLLAERRSKEAVAGLVTTELDDPTGYGRIVRDAQGQVQAIVEETEATAAERQIREVNAGIYSFQPQHLFPALEKLDASNTQGEYYLTDLVADWYQQGRAIATLPAGAEEVMGVNNRQELARAGQIMRGRLLDRLMLAGVTIEDPASTFVESSVRIEPDAVLRPFTMLYGNTRIGSGSLVGPFTRIKDSVLEKKVTVENSVLDSVHLESGVKVGPFAYLRPGTRMEEGSKAGTFVEIKASFIGPNSKVPHLSYIGDTTMGQGVNIGAGTITCNYDGWDKHQTFIDDQAFIGSNTNLVAPVHVGQGALIGAGSTISRDVPAYALALERSQEKVIADWVKRRIARHQAAKKS